MIKIINNWNTIFNGKTKEDQGGTPSLIIRYYFTIINSYCKVKVFFLNGFQQPQIEYKPSFDRNSF